MYTQRLLIIACICSTAVAGCDATQSTAPLPIENQLARPQAGAIPTDDVIPVSSVERNGTSALAEAIAELEAIAADSTALARNRFGGVQGAVTVNEVLATLKDLQQGAAQQRAVGYAEAIVIDSDWDCSLNGYSRVSVSGGAIPAIRTFAFAAYTFIEERFGDCPFQFPDKTGGEMSERLRPVGNGEWQTYSTNYSGWSTYTQGQRDIVVTGGAYEAELNTRHWAAIALVPNPDDEYSSSNISEGSQ